MSLSSGHLAVAVPAVPPHRNACTLYQPQGCALEGWGGGNTYDMIFAFVCDYCCDHCLYLKQQKTPMNGNTLYPHVRTHTHTRTQTHACRHTYLVPFYEYLKDRLGLSSLLKMQIGNVPNYWKYMHCCTISK